MAPLIPAAELRLSYPLYACDFDPQDANRLVVGGGGSTGRHGIGNKLTVLDVSRPDAIESVSEIELSRDEDSVTSLAVVGPRQPRNSTVVYAGVNGSEEDIAKGKNEHFRVFGIDQPSKNKPTPKITELSRSALFKTADGEDEAYQRIVRLSPPFAGLQQGQQQVGAIATGMTDKNAQIVIFDVPAAGNNATTPKARGHIQLPKEAVDMDIIQVGEGEWQLVYCDDYEMHTINVSQKSDHSTQPECVFTMPHDHSGGPRPSFRSIRYLTPTFVLAASNLPQAKGVVLQGFRLPKPEDRGKEGKEGKARLAVSTKLPKSVARATAMTVRNLAPPATPAQKQGDTQFVVAVAGMDSSVTLYTLEHQAVGDVSLIIKLHIVTTLKEVHQGPISGLAFSYFTPPTSSSSSPKSTQQPAALKLASIGSMANTCVVHTLPLKKVVEKNVNGGVAKPPKQARYVLALKSHGPGVTQMFSVMTVLALILALVVQIFCEVKGISGPVLGARRWTPVSWHEQYAYRPGGAKAYEEELRKQAQQQQAVVVEETVPVAQVETEEKQAEKIEDMLAEYLVGMQLGSEGQPVVLNVAEEQVKVEATDGEGVREAAAAAAGRKWEELPAEQKAAWKRKLKQAGHWGEEMGETIFKNILFGEIGAMVGHAVGG